MKNEDWTKTIEKGGLSILKKPGRKPVELTKKLPRDCPEMWNLQGKSFDDKNTLEVDRLFLFK